MSRFGRLGKTQRRIMSYIVRCGGNGAFIGTGCRADEFKGYNIQEIEISISRLMNRNIIRKEGARYLLNGTL